jgi:hypothetical protein
VHASDLMSRAYLSIPITRAVGEITLGSTVSKLSAERGSMRNPFCASQRGASNE